METAKPYYPSANFVALRRTSVSLAHLLLAMALLQCYYLLLPVGPNVGLSLFPLVTLLLAAGGVLALGWGSRLVLATFWVVAAVFQNLFIGLYLNVTSLSFDAFLLPLFEIKSVLLAGAIGIVFALGLASQRLPALYRFDLILALFVCLVVFSFLTTTAPLVSKLAYLRNFTAFILLHLLGRFVVRKDRDIEVFTRFLIGVAAALTFFSVLDVLWPELWTSVLHVDRIQAAKGPISHTSDFLGFHVRRLKSAVGEPVNAGYIFSCLALVALTTRRYGWALLLFAQLALTFAKGPMLIFGTGALFWLYVQRARARGYLLRARALVWIAASVVLGMGSYALLTAINVPLVRTTTWVHFVGLGFGVANALTSPLGQGLGSGGNYLDVAGLIGAAERPASADWLGSGAESAVGVVGTQLGGVGLLLFALVLVSIVRASWKSVVAARSQPNGASLPVAIVSCGGLVGILFTSLLQESALSPQAAGLFYLLSGMAVASLAWTREANRKKPPGLNSRSRVVRGRRPGVA